MTENKSNCGMAQGDVELNEKIKENSLGSLPFTDAIFYCIFAIFTYFYHLVAMVI